MKTVTGASTRRLISLTGLIASSGEGTVWQTSLNGYLAKLYHSPDRQRVQKLEVMIASPPVDPMLSRNHISFAWPKELLKDGSGACVGFLMPAIPQGVSLLNVYNPRLRKQKIPKFNWRYLHTTALNIAWIIQEIHTKGYVLGDIKPQNVLVNDRALVSVIDIDSFQVCDPQTGQLYRCTVGSEGFTPAELLGQELSDLEQTAIHDHFRLAVIIYLLLFGNHPFKGEWIGSDDPPDPTELIRRGFWPYASNSLIQSGPHTIPLNIVHPELRKHFLRCFNDGHTMPHLRPTAQDWCNALQLAIADLVVCDRENTHYYSRTYGKCYWCERKQKLGIDVFPDPAKAPASIPASAALPLLSRSPKDKRLPNGYFQSTPFPQAARPQSLRASRKQLITLASGTIFLSICAYVYLLFYLSYRPVHLVSPANRLVPLPPISNLTRISLVNTLDRHADVVSAIAISSNGKTLASSSYDGEIKLWNLSTGSLLQTLAGHSDWVSSVAISPNGKTLASGSYDGEIKLWNLSTGALLQTLAGHSGVISSTAISPNGRTLASGSYDGEIKLWNLSTGSLLQTLTGHSGAVSSIAISPNGRTLASGSYDGEIKLWNLSTGALLRTLKGHRDWVSSVAISPNGKTLASGSYDGKIKLWNLSTGAPTRTLKGHSGRVSSIAISPNGQSLAGGSSDGELKLWKLGSGKLLHSITGHASVVTAVAISPDGRTLASSSRDSTIKLWQLP
jgi:WD40 repeat protein